MSALLDVRDLRVDRSGEPLLDGVSLSLSAPTFVAVTGPSGSGKSSLLQVIAGMRRPRSGTVYVAGEETTGIDGAIRHGVVAMTESNDGLVRSLTARENVMLPLVADGVRGREAMASALTWLDRVGLEEWSNHLVDELSGGQQQRVGVAQVLARAGRVVVLDEPTSALDAGNRERVVALLRARAQEGAVVLMTTNDPEAAEAADAILALEAGRASWV